MKRKPQKAPVQPPDRIITIVIQANVNHKQVTESIMGQNVTIDEVIEVTEYFLNKARQTQVELLKKQAQQAPKEQPQPNITEHPQQEASVSEAQP